MADSYSATTAALLHHSPRLDPLRVSNEEGDPVTEQQLARMAKRRLAILRHAEQV